MPFKYEIKNFELIKTNTQIDDQEWSRIPAEGL